MAGGLFDLSGKVAVITGGNGGIGLGFARGIARQGGDVEIWGRSDEKNAAARSELEQFGGRVIARKVDVASEAEIIAAYQQTMDDFGRVDCVFANAGVPPNTRSTLEMTAKSWRNLLEVNMDGAFFTLREGARLMVERARGGEPGGSLVFCGSLSMFHGLAGRGNYAAAKGAMQAFIRSLAVEFGPYGIRANTIAPGHVVTPMSGPAHEPTARERFVANRTPVLRSGFPSDFEAIAAYLCCDASSFHTGDTIVIDGGSVVTPPYMPPIGGNPA